MCGIVGVAGSFSTDRLEATVDAMNGAITHRGPDDSGTWAGDGFAFGMRRLSIIDLAGGHQPMQDARTGLRLVYNGEVYNYKSLRADLESKGISFTTSSDTEVVLQGLASKGPEAVHEWNGMFAVAAWDEQRKRLLLIRDRMGVKPLYYYWDGATLMFASELKAFLAVSWFPRRVNPQAIWDYLTYRYVPGTQTMWQNVWKLPPGHMLDWSPGTTPQIRQYWKTESISPEESVDIDQKTKEFEDLFLDSVSMRLLASDVPVGVMLSGGLDSSAIAAAAVELGHKRFHTFSVGFADGGNYSELGFARTVAQHLGVENHEVVIDRDQFLEILPDAVRGTDEPLADLTIVPLLAILRVARQHVKVALSGEGSDEILAGYYLHETRRKLETIRQLRRVPPAILSPLGRALGLVSSDAGNKIRRIAATPLSQWNVSVRNHMTWHWDDGDKRALWPDFDGRDSITVLEQMYGETSSSDLLDQLLSVLQKSWLVEDLLMKADKMSMATSIELRVPFLDYRIVQWANRQPVGTKIGDINGQDVTKRVLRRFAMKRLPREIIERPKMGFPVPVSRWLQEEGFARWAREFLTGKDARISRLFDASEIERQLRVAAAGDVPTGDKCWLLLVLETWFREFDVDVDAEILPGTSAAAAAV